MTTEQLKKISKSNENEINKETFSMKKEIFEKFAELNETDIEAELERTDARERIEFFKTELPKCINNLRDAQLDFLLHEELPGRLDLAEDAFIKDYEANTLQPQLDIIKEGLKRDFMENTLPRLLEDEKVRILVDFQEFASQEIEAEEKLLIKGFETKTQELLDKERAKLCGEIKARTLEHGKTVTEYKDIKVSETDIASKNNQRSAVTMNFPLRPILTKKFFMELPAGVYLASNGLKSGSNGTPKYADYVAEKGNPRILQWEILKAQGITQRVCNVLAGKDDYENYIKSNWPSAPALMTEKIS